MKRELFKTFINCTPDAEAATYQVLGDDLEELNIEMSANVSRTSNILGENSITIDRYEKTASVEPYKADSGTPLFTFLKGIIDDEKTLDELKTDVVNVDVFGTETSGAYPAYKEEVFVEVTSYGGSTEGFQIPFNVHFTGKRTKGAFNPATKAFVAA
ncbi:hypothetical protein Ami103574_02580 [Aminipila butyrica]|uniref:Phage tail protein n=1 Tax=Aminipila butyrica TaxID=433296 RepID=A0A858BYK5_9FIRM|nr:hypothetical protein Ami103574_02580 [Aminipila butyrica]